MWSTSWQLISDGSYAWTCEEDGESIYRWTEGALVVRNNHGQSYRVEGVPRVWYDAATQTDGKAALLLNAAAGQRLFGEATVMSGELHRALGAVGAQTALTLRRGATHLLQTLPEAPKPMAATVEAYAFGAVAFAHSASHTGTGQLADDPSPRLVDMAVSDLASSVPVSKGQIIHGADVMEENADGAALGQAQNALACARTWRVPEVVAER